MVLACPWGPSSGNQMPPAKGQKESIKNWGCELHLPASCWGWWERHLVSDHVPTGQTQESVEGILDWKAYMESDLGAPMALLLTACVTLRISPISSFIKVEMTGLALFSWSTRARTFFPSFSFSFLFSFSSTNISLLPLWDAPSPFSYRLHLTP